MNNDGRYWDRPWSLVDGCTPCSPGCERCWSAGLSHRFEYAPTFKTEKFSPQFTGEIIVHTERLDMPLKRRKPTVYAVWNDLFHGDVPDSYRNNAYCVMNECRRHTFLILTKRPLVAVEYFKRADMFWLSNIWHGLTVCNQQEADEKIPIFLRVSGDKFLSIEPMLGEIDVSWALGKIPSTKLPNIDTVILGGETGPGARPMHPDWVRSIREQCRNAGIPFFFKSWGSWKGSCDYVGGRRVPGSARIGRYLDGRTHDDLPWRRAL